MEHKEIFPDWWISQKNANALQRENSSELSPDHQVYNKYTNIRYTVNTIFNYYSIYIVNLTKIYINYLMNNIFLG